jgi:hypothetical protein
VPLEPTVQRIEALKQAGVNASLILLDRPTHFQTGAHAEGLRRAIPWIRNVWETRPK